MPAARTRSAARAAGVGAQVGDRGDSHARRAQRERGVEAAVAGRGDDGRARPGATA